MPPTYSRRALGAFSIIVVVSSITASADDKFEPQVRFNADVRPILADACFSCHGPDAKQRQGELRLDTEEGLFAQHDERAVVVPGRPGESELYRRISSADPNVQMPPPDSDRKLTQAQIDKLRKWIEQGAPWEGHWSFQPLKRPPIPKVSQSQWVRTPIDSFVLAKLDANMLLPSADASPETLLRRVTLDLTGLPPTPEEIDAYLADSSPDRYERLVDRLLASPAYGEHMRAVLGGKELWRRVRLQLLIKRIPNYIDRTADNFCSLNCNGTH